MRSHLPALIRSLVLAALLFPLTGTSAEVDPNLVCPDKMKLVTGKYCPDASIQQACKKSMDARPTDASRCLEFFPSHCRAPAAARIDISVCMDVFEYPNQAGAVPLVQTSWNEAKRRCAEQGKRLCDRKEWTFACEGPDMLAYSIGNRRYPQGPEVRICNFDHPQFAHGVDHRAPSGAFENCVSPFEVHDMNGNVDEWVNNDQYNPSRPNRINNPFPSALKGGHWGPVRDRCRPSTTAHNQGYANYEIGFRCCQDPVSPKPAASGAGSAPPSAAPAELPTAEKSQ